MSMKKLFAALAVLTASGCATMSDQDNGSLTANHPNTVAGCGVGNYKFRHLKGACGAEEKAPEKTVAVTPVPAAPEAPAPVVVPRPAESAKLVDNKIEISEEVKFQTGKSVIAADSKKVLDDVSKVIKDKEDKIASVEVEGHTDHIGNAAKNQTLSQKRADAVRAYLIKKGIPGKMLTAKGFGSTKPKFDPATSAKTEWAQNRRVEFTASMK